MAKQLTSLEVVSRSDDGALSHFYSANGFFLSAKSIVDFVIAHDCTGGDGEHGPGSLFHPLQMLLDEAREEMEKLEAELVRQKRAKGGGE